jgi:septal ring factor EnvC (AmiA/AmiB activator)
MQPTSSTVGQLQRQIEHDKQAMGAKQHDLKRMKEEMKRDEMKVEQLEREIETMQTHFADNNKRLTEMAEELAQISKQKRAA